MVTQERYQKIMKNVLSRIIYIVNTAVTTMLESRSEVLGHEQISDPPPKKMGLP